MAARKYIYFCETDKFGYTLQVIGRTEEEARQAMIEEYIKAYKQRNGVDPRDWGNHYYTTFVEELYVKKREFGKVEWT